jgi:hypothetical protein
MRGTSGKIPAKSEQILLFGRKGLKYNFYIQIICCSRDKKILPYRKSLPVKYFLCKKKHITTDVEQIGLYDLMSDTDSVCSS